jgi:hypothetical protein
MNYLRHCEEGFSLIEVEIASGFRPRNDMEDRLCMVEEFSKD